MPTLMFQGDHHIPQLPHSNLLSENSKTKRKQNDTSCLLFSLNRKARTQTNPLVYLNLFMKSVRIGAYGLVMGLAPKPIGWAASSDYGT